MEIGKITWRVALAVINAYWDGNYSHISSGELRSKFGISLNNQPIIYKKLIEDGWVEDCTVNGYFKRFKIIKPYPCPNFILDNRLNNPQKNLLLRCIELDINDSLSKKEMCRRLYGNEGLSHLNTPFNKIKEATGTEVLDILKNISYISKLIPENAVYTEHGYRSYTNKIATKSISESTKTAKNLIKKSSSCFKHRRTKVLEYNLTEEYLERLLINQDYKDYYTGIIPKDYIEYSIDRIDSNLGYIEGNVVITTNIINVMKNDLTTEEFKEQIKLLYNNISNF